MSLFWDSDGVVVFRKCKHGEMNSPGCVKIINLPIGSCGVQRDSDSHRQFLCVGPWENLFSFRN